MIDTHCHIYDERLYKNLDQVIKKAQKEKIEKIICIGDNLDTSKKSIEIAESYDNVYATVGIHPHEAKNAPNDFIKELEELSNHPKVVAIGEIGLDYYYNHSKKEIQQNIFEKQLKLANNLNLPVVIHCRDADDDLFCSLIATKNSLGVVHSFASSIEFAKKIIGLGLMISFTGMITFIKKLEKVANEVDLNKIMVETDSPYLTPVPLRGKINEPANVKFIVNKIAEIKKVPREHVVNITTQNALSLFKKMSN